MIAPKHGGGRGKGDVHMNNTKTPDSDLKTLETFSQQHHMYTPDQLRNVLRIAIGIAREALRDSFEAFRSGFGGDMGLLVFPKDGGPGEFSEDVLKAPSVVADIKVYAAGVVEVRRLGEIILSKDKAWQGAAEGGVKEKAGDNLKTVVKFSKQLQMYTVEQLRSVLNSTIDIAREAITDNVKLKAYLSDSDADTYLVIFPKERRLPALPGDDVVMEVPCKDGGLKFFKAKVAEIRSYGERCIMRDVSWTDSLERREAKRFPVHINAEYCDLQNEATRETLHEGRVLNVSKTGLYLAADTPLKLGTVIALMFEIRWADIEVPIGAMGTIVREKREETYSEYLYRYGVRFNSSRRVA